MRYDGRTIFRTRHPLYKQVIKEKGLNELRYYETPKFVEMDEDMLEEIEDIGHVWSLGDRYYKLAAKYYGEPELWWVIAWYNSAPTEAHLEIGDPISIPTPLWKVLSALGM